MLIVWLRFLQGRLDEEESRAELLLQSVAEFRIVTDWLLDHHIAAKSALVAIDALI